MNQTLQTGCDSNPCKLFKYHRNIEYITSLGVKLPTHANHTNQSVKQNRAKPARFGYNEVVTESLSCR